MEREPGRQSSRRKGSGRGISQSDYDAKGTKAVPARPEPDTPKFEGMWQDAAKKSLSKKNPVGDRPKAKYMDLGEAPVLEGKKLTAAA